MGLSPDLLVEIDELDLAAVPVARRHVVRASFERELARLATDQAWTARLLAGGDRSVDARRPAVGLDVPLDGNPVMVGVGLARAVAAELVR